MTDDRLERASVLLKMGKINDARQIIEGFLKENRTHTYAWWLYAETWPNTEDKKRVWGYCLRFNPESVEAKRALAELNSGTNNQPQVMQKNNLSTGRKKTSATFIWFSGCAGLLVIFVIAGSFMFLASRPADATPYRHSTPVEYYLYVPKDYSPAGNQWPLFCRASWIRWPGLDCWNMWQTYAEKEGFILLCPTIPGDSGGYYLDVGERTVWAAANEVQKNYRVGSRMFLTASQQEHILFQGFAYHYPNAVSGLAILSTGNYIEGIQSRVPILVVIGGADHPDSIRANEEFVSYMSRNGFDIEYHVLPGVGHWPTGETKKLTIELFRKTIGK